MRAFFSMVLLLIPLFFFGCATVQPTFEDSNQYFLEQTVNKMDLTDEIRTTIPPKSTVAVLSMEKRSTVDEPIIAMIEDQLIRSLLDEGYKVVERDEQMVYNFIREKKTDCYSLLFFPGTPELDAENPKTAKEFPVGDNWVFKTSMESADYLISYRVLEMGILYRPIYDSPDHQEREGLVRLHVRVQKADTGEIVFADNVNGKNTSRVPNEFVSQLANYHYSFFPHEFPLQPRMKAGAIKQVQQAMSSDNYLYFSPRVHFVKDIGFGAAIGYGGDSWGRVTTDYKFEGGEEDRTSAFLNYAFAIPITTDAMLCFAPQIGFGWQSRWKENVYYSEYDHRWHYNSEGGEGMSLRLSPGIEYNLGKMMMLRAAYDIGIKTGSGSDYQFNDIILEVGFKF